MLQLGILTPDQYVRTTSERRSDGSGVSLDLLDVGDEASEEEILRFEEISASLRTSFGTARTTRRHRMADVDEACLDLMKQCYGDDDELLIQDRAASNCLTSEEWAKPVLANFHKAHFEASDGLVYLFRISLRNGRTYFAEPSGRPLQCVQGPFAVCLHPRESYRHPVNQLIALLSNWSFRRLRKPHELTQFENERVRRIDKISCIHPEARRLAKSDPRFRICERSIFERTPGIDVLRTMNVLNLVYFKEERLVDAIRAAFESVREGGLWIVGRTDEIEHRNDVTFFNRAGGRWEVVKRMGNGSEIEELALRQSVSQKQS